MKWWEGKRVILIQNDLIFASAMLSGCWFGLLKFHFSWSDNAADLPVTQLFSWESAAEDNWTKRTNPIPAAAAGYICYLPKPDVLFVPNFNKQTFSLDRKYRFWIFELFLCFVSWTSQGWWWFKAGWFSSTWVTSSWLSGKPLSSDPRCATMRNKHNENKFKLQRLKAQFSMILFFPGVGFLADNNKYTSGCQAAGCVFPLLAWTERMKSGLKCLFSPSGCNNNLLYVACSSDIYFSSKRAFSVLPRWNICYFGARLQGVKHSFFKIFGQISDHQDVGQSWNIWEIYFWTFFIWWGLETNWSEIGRMSQFWERIHFKTGSCRPK